MRGRPTGEARPAAAVATSLALALAVVVSAEGCSPAPPEQRAAKVVLIGWDGATWDVIRPMLQRGELPVLGGLIEGGGTGVLMAEPPLLSPVVWTTLATGFSPRDHGITGFELADPTSGVPILASSFHRRRAALWQMVSAGGKEVGFVGWWSSWPAEPVEGYLVSDHLAYNRWDDWVTRGNKERAGAFQLTFPTELADELGPHAVPPSDVGVETIGALAAFDEDEAREMMEAERPVMFHAPSVVRYGYSTDASNQSFAEYLLESRVQPDLFSITYILSDVAGHVFWHRYEPELYPGADRHDDRLRDAIPNVYRQLDRWTGEILKRIDPDSTVIVLSDHGMGAKRILPRPGVNPAGDHTPEGIFVISGPGIPRGADLGVLQQIDLAPTVLALLDLPVAEDMPGRVVLAALPEGAYAEPQWIPSYGEGGEELYPEGLSPADEEYKDRLRALGYIR
jgi:predicted AlkP superfamily pyrophosphatase or phosphodiesterase